MTRKHYKKIAEVIATQRIAALTVEQALDRVTSVLCEVFKEDNSRFREDKFVQATEEIC